MWVVSQVWMLTGDKVETAINIGRHRTCLTFCAMMHFTPTIFLTRFVSCRTVMPAHDLADEESGGDRDPSEGLSAHTHSTQSQNLLPIALLLRVCNPRARAFAERARFAPLQRPVVQGSTCSHGRTARYQRRNQYFGGGCAAAATTGSTSDGDPA